MTTAIILRRPPAKERANTYGLPRGEPIRRALVKVFRAQREQTLAFLREHAKSQRFAVKADQDVGGIGGGHLPHAFPEFELGALAMSERMTPMIAALWDQGGSKVMARLGLDPNEWQVTNPHVRAMIDRAALDFCQETNQTTSLALNDALERTRQVLREGLGTEGGPGRSIDVLTKEINKVFDQAETWRARRIAASEASRAVHAGQEQAAIETGIVAGWEWLASGDACPKCLYVARKAKFVRLGQPFAVVGDNPTYSSVRMPPLHPSCQCTALEVVAPALSGEPEPPWAETLQQPKPEAQDYPDGKLPEPKPPKPVAGKEPTAKPEPAPAPPPPPKPRSPLEAARHEQQAVNRQWFEQAGGDYPAQHEQFPDRIPPGKIEDRIARYTWGDEKLKAILKIGQAFESRESKHIARDTALSGQIKELRRELFRLEDKAKAATGKARKEADAELAEAKAEMEKLKAQRQANEDQHARIKDRRARVLARTLRTDRPTVFPMPNMWEGSVNVEGEPLGPLGEPVRTNAEAAKRWLEQVVATGDSGAVQTVYGSADNRRAHYYSGSQDYIQLDNKNETGTVVHEVGHLIEHKLKTTNLSAGTKSEQFLAYRVGDEQPTDMHTKFKGYDPGETGRKDRFDSVFEERRAYYTGKDYGRGAGTEILSMGMELLYNDPVRFAKNDPEYCKFVLGMLDGSLR